MYYIFVNMESVDLAQNSTSILTYAITALAALWLIHVCSTPQSAPSARVLMLVPKAFQILHLPPKIHPQALPHDPNPPPLKALHPHRPPHPPHPRPPPALRPDRARLPRRRLHRLSPRVQRYPPRRLAFH